jgi:hypothetical protein
LSQQFTISSGKKKETNQDVLDALNKSKNSEKFTMEDISKFDKSKLKQTETTETSLMDVVGVGSTSHSSLEEIKEHFDSKETLEICVDEIVDLIKKSKHLVIYTGAGISTSANIPGKNHLLTLDYRGPNGVWTLKDKGMTPDGIEIDQAFPTYSHYAMVELMNKGILKHVVSTNVDGLHRRSGIPKDKLSELHGNAYKEYCSKCSKEHLRSFDTCKTLKKNHLTGRMY